MSFCHLTVAATGQGQAPAVPLPDTGRRDFPSVDPGQHAPGERLLHADNSFPFRVCGRSHQPRLRRFGRRCVCETQPPHQGII